MTVMNEIDRYHLAMDVYDRVPRLCNMAALAKQRLQARLIEHKEYIERVGDDMPEIRDWSGRSEFRTSDLFFSTLLGYAKYTRNTEAIRPLFSAI